VVASSSPIRSEYQIRFSFLSRWPPLRWRTDQRAYGSGSQDCSQNRASTLRTHTSPSDRLLINITTYLASFLLEKIMQFLVQPLDIFSALPGTCFAVRDRVNERRRAVLTSSPMAPNTWKHLQRPNVRPHVGDFDLRVFWSCAGGQSKSRMRESLATLRKYKSVLLGSTRLFALMPFIAALKSPLYGSWSEQSPACQV